VIAMIKSQFHRIYSDDGRGDKDFSEQEERLRAVHEKLLEAAAALSLASDILRGVIHGKPRLH
jgi:hypothetical protein